MTATKGAVTLRKPKSTHTFVAVEDRLPAARLAHKAYLDARNELVKWGSDPEEAGKRYVRDWCRGFSKNPKIANLLDQNKIESEQNGYEDEERARHREVEEKAARLVEALNDPKLKAQLKTMGGAGLAEAAALVQGLGESITGGKHIERELPEGGGEGVLAWLLSAETAEKIDKRLDLYVKSPFELTEPLLDALAETAGTIVRLKKEKAVEYVATFISTRFQVQVEDLITHQTITLRGGMTSVSVTSREFTVLKSEKLLDKEGVELFKGKIEVLGRLVAAVNFAAKLDVMAHDPSLKNSIETLGALADLLDTSKTVSEALKSFVRSGREVAADGAPKAAAAAIDVADATGGAGRTLISFLGKGIAEKATPLAVLAGMCDAVTGSMEAYESVENGNYADMLANVGTAVGGCLIAAAGVLELSGAGADATIVGAPAGIVLGALGLLVGVAGAIAGFFTGQSEVQVWANHCCYGLRYAQDKYGDWNNNLEKQIDALGDALYHAKVSGTLAQDETVLQIETTGISRSSKMTCYVGASTSDSDYPARQDAPLRDDQPDCEIEFGESEQKDVVKKIKLTVKMPAAGTSVNWEKITLQMTLDPDGDGAEVLKRTAEIKQGTLAWVWSQI